MDTGKFAGAKADPGYATGAFTPTFVTGGGSNPTTPGRSTTCPGCNIDAFAGGNVDNEAVGIDTWYISTKDATGNAKCGNKDETVQVAGTPYLSYNDVDCDT